MTTISENMAASTASPNAIDPAPPPPANPTRPLRAPTRWWTLMRSVQRLKPTRSRGGAGRSPPHTSPQISAAHEQGTPVVGSTNTLVCSFPVVSVRPVTRVLPAVVVRERHNEWLARF